VDYTIAFDVGGSYIKSAVLQGQVLRNGTYAVYPAQAQAKRDEWLDYMVGVILSQVEKLTDTAARVNGIGFAFPGPFDYENGICYIKGLAKFENLYQVNLKHEIHTRLLKGSAPRLRLNDGFQIRFENDAALFALGEYIGGKAKGYHRAICLTLGTGAGSAFLVNGAVVKEGEGVPPDGVVFPEQFRDSIVDDYISRRGILRLAADAGMDCHLDVLDLAELAKQGDPVARRVFHQFGRDLGEMLSRYLLSFRPEIVVIGGQIAKSHSLFVPGFQETVGTEVMFADNRLGGGWSCGADGNVDGNDESKVLIEFDDDTSRMTLLGVSKLLSNTGGVCV
jgi:glucokinase